MLLLLLLLLASSASSAPRRQRGQEVYDISSGGDQNAVALNYPLIGVNMPGLLWDALARPGEGLSQGLSAASAACSTNMTLVRFAAGPKYPDGVGAYTRNATFFWQVADSVVYGLAAAGCAHLVPTLFHNPFAFTDFAVTGLGTLARAAMNQTSDAAGVRALGATMAYIDAFVKRYSGLVSIVAWELSHEMNLLFDVDLTASPATLVESGAAPAPAWVAPRNGTKAERDASDSLTTEMGVGLMRAWLSRVKASDPMRRPVSTGHAVPRVNAQALRLSGALAPDPAQVGFAPDTAEQFVDYLNYTHRGFDWISLHFVDVQPALAVEPPRFPASKGRAGAGQGVAQVLQLATALAANNSLQFVFVGQFGASPNASNPAQARPFLNGAVDAMELLAEGADTAAAAPGATGLISYGALANWMYAPANGTLLGSLWPGEAAGALAYVQAHNLLHVKAAVCTPGVCCPAAYVQAYADAKARGLLALNEACTARMALLSQQMFGPPVSYDVFTVMCKGECRQYSAMLRWLQSALDATSCTCNQAFEGLMPGGSFWCPRSPADLLCAQTGWCFDDKKYENYTCSAGACGRWEQYSDAYNKARSRCGVNYDGAAATSISAAVALGALALAVGAAARWE